MASWEKVATEAPELAALARGYLDAGVHKTIATLRSDGSPRISGTEVSFRGEDLWIGSMPRSLKGRDLRRDPRYALHSASADPPGWSGDAKLAGRAVLVDDGAVKDSLRTDDVPEEDFDLFRLEIGELSVVRLNDERTGLVIERWAEGRGVRRIERS